MRRLLLASDGLRKMECVPIMKRILVFDSSCPLCTGIAHKVCSEAGELIHDVWSLADTRTQAILTAAGVAALAKPAIIEISSEKTVVITGPRFRWRIMKLLGPQGALRLARVIAGDLAAATLSPGKALQAPSRQSEAGRIQGLRAEVAQMFGRRKFLRLVASVTAGFTLITGLGFSKFAHAAKARSEGGARDSFEPHWYGWTKNLDIESATVMDAVGADREARWQQFVSSRNLQKLTASRGFEARVAALEVNSALLSGVAPPSGDDMDEDHPNPPYFAARQMQLKNGQHVNLTFLLTSKLMVHSLELYEGERSLKSGLKLYELHLSPGKDGTVVPLASLNRGRFMYRSQRFATQTEDVNEGNGGVIGNGSSGGAV